jgi:hypothetical protein
MRPTTNIVTIAAIYLCVLQRGDAQQVLTVPAGGGTPVLIDGQFAADEWSDAIILRVAASVDLYLKQYKGHVFLGVKMAAKSRRYVDMFLLAQDKHVYNLHASMQLGERVLVGSNWSDTNPPTRWGYHLDWTANEAKLDPSADPSLPVVQRIFPDDGIEFQFRRSRFQGKQWRIRIEIRDFAGQLPDIIFPADSERKTTARWAILELG